MDNFTPQQLQQIHSMAADMVGFYEVFQRSMKGLSLTAFKQDMLAIQLKCEAALAKMASSQPQK